MRRLKLTVLILGAALLAIGSVWGISRLSGTDAPPAASGAPVSSPEAAQTGDDAGVVVEVEPLYIVKEETRYELVKGRGDALGVRLVVENMPDKYEVKLGGSQATVDDDQRLPGGGNRREVFATVNFAAELEQMRQNPDEQLRLPVEVTDLEAADNNGSVAIYINPRRLRLDDKGAPAAPGPVKVERAEALAPRPAPTRKVRRDRPPAQQTQYAQESQDRQQQQDTGRLTPTPKKPCPTYKKILGQCRPSAQPTQYTQQSQGGQQQPGAARPTPTPKKPCPTYKKMLGLC